MQKTKHENELASSAFTLEMQRFVYVDNSQACRPDCIYLLLSLLQPELGRNYLNLSE